MMRRNRFYVRSLHNEISVSAHRNIIGPERLGWYSTNKEKKMSNDENRRTQSGQNPGQNPAGRQDLNNQKKKPGSTDTDSSEARESKE